MLEAKSIILPEIPSNHFYHVFHQYVIQSYHRNQLKERLEKRGVLTLIHYPFTINKQPVYLNRYSQREALPITEKISRKILSLPIYPELSVASVDTIIDTIHKVL